MVYTDSSLISTTKHYNIPSEANADSVTTEPNKWPGVNSLRALLDREKDPEAPNLNVLLCETYVAIYMSLLSYSLATCDPHILYRLVGQTISKQYWSSLFGGGSKTSLQVTTSSPSAPSSSAKSLAQVSE